jgi:hypothetical protein
MGIRMKSHLLLACSSLLILTACGAGKPTEGGASEQLLIAEGPMALVEEEKQINPVDQHMAARKQVNPSDDSTKYTSKVEDAKTGEPVHFRVLKLERQMTDLRGDFDKLLRPLKKVPSSDNELNDTISQIEMRQQQAAAEHVSMYDQAAAPMPAMTNDMVPPADLPATTKSPEMLGEPLGRAEVPPPPVKPEATEPKITAPEAVKAAPVAPPEKAADDSSVAEEKPAVAAVAEPAASANGTNVSGIRVGEHPGKVRIVLDLTGPAKFTADVDNDEKLLLVDLPGAGWSTEMAQALKNPLVKGYSAQKNASGGTTLAIELAKPSKLLMATALAPNQTYGHRIALDVGAL